MKCLTLFALMLTFALPAVSHAALTDQVPPNDPAWHDADMIQKAGIIIGNPAGLGTVTGRRAFTRRYFAGAVAQLMQQAESDPAQAALISASPSALAALSALVTEFTPELVSMKQNVAQYKFTLSALAAEAGHPLVDHPFSDVPADHWAASAVETLRRAGIVAGYPAGTYRTATGTYPAASGDPPQRGR